MEIRADGRVLFGHEYMDFDDFVHLIRNFDNCKKIEHDDYYKELVFETSDTYDYIFYRDISPDSPAYKYVEELIKVVKDYKEYKRRKNMYAAAINDGKIPEDIEDKELLINYINNAINSSKATIKSYKRNRIICLTGSTLAASLMSGVIVAATGAHDASLVISFVLPVLSYTFASAVTSFEKDEIKNLEAKIDYYKTIIDKVKGTGTGNPVQDELNELEYEGLLKIKKYNDKFVNRAAEIVALVRQLKPSKKEKFEPLVDSLLDEYKRRTKEILEAETDIPFGKARDIYALYVEMQSSLNKLEFDVRDQLRKQQELENIHDEVDDLRSELYRDDEVRQLFKVG